MTLKYLGEEPTTDEMGRACGTYGGEETCMYSFGGATLPGIDNLEDLGVDG
jgi:hypothetical protein